MKKNIIVMISICLFLVGISESFSANRGALSLTYNSTTCDSSELYQFFCYHIDHSARPFVKEDGTPMMPQFYYVYFFQKNDVKYVTIWWSPFSWDIGVLKKANSRRGIKRQYLKVRDYNFVIITDKEFNAQDLLSPCSSCLLDIKYLPQGADMSYEGVSYPKTYIYYKDDNRYKFERQEQYNIDFLGKERVEWEKFQLQRRQEEHSNVKLGNNL